MTGGLMLTVEQERALGQLLARMDQSWLAPTLVRLLHQLLRRNAERAAYETQVKQHRASCKICLGGNAKEPA